MSIFDSISDIAHAAKLSRIYTEQLTALQKYRGKGNQTVVVKHVTVADGGQAIVGNVTQGVGQPSKEGTQSHEKPALSHARESALRIAFEAEREAVPVASIA